MYSFLSLTNSDFRSNFHLLTKLFNNAVHNQDQDILTLLEYNSLTFKEIKSSKLCNKTYATLISERLLNPTVFDSKFKIAEISLNELIDTVSKVKKCAKENKNKHLLVKPLTNFNEFNFFIMETAIYTHKVFDKLRGREVSDFFFEMATIHYINGRETCMNLASILDLIGSKFFKEDKSLNDIFALSFNLETVKKLNTVAIKKYLEDK